MLLWVTGGYISALVFAWITDEAPVVMPELTQLVFSYLHAPSLSPDVGQPLCL